MKKLTCFLILLCSCRLIYAQQLLTTAADKNSMPLPDTIYVDKSDDWLANKAASLLQTDIDLVTGKRPVIIHNLSVVPKNLIIIGTVSGNPLIAKMNIRLKGQWEAFRIQTLTNPIQGVNRALLITGSDKRGTAYGVTELSRQLGVSPWYWWADVPVKKKSSVFIRKGTYDYGSPSVKYRGIFINDEAPAFSGWTKEKFGGFNHRVYEKVFELLIRLKANYLWPAMWGNAFNDDDTLNPVLADKWGIVMGTSHHEPMLRAQTEWKRYGKGAWDYTKNENVLRDFWKTGIRNMGKHESIVTIGMRGDGDEPMTEGTATALLERIVKDQRQIISDVTGKPAAATPQLWALYKEVQDYYDKGMRVPDDVTLLLCDDNWGNIRKLPKLTDPPRNGGYGIYYHFDYVGDPRNYKWLNTNNIARVWEQMHLAKEYGADKIWIVNVGDIKPMEFPVSFFLDYAWDTKKWNADNLRNYYTQWAREQFGSAHDKEIGELVRTYSQYAARKKPELINAETYDYEESSRIYEQWTTLLEKAEKMEKQMPPLYKDAYFQLVLHPIKAFTILQQMYFEVGASRRFNDTSAARLAKELYEQDSLLSVYYNKTMAGGKWNQMMDQTHIGYTYWQQPEKNRMPIVRYVSDKPALFRKKQIIRFDFVIEAAKYSKAVGTDGISWKVIPDIGRTGDGVTTFPVTDTVKKNRPHLEYTLDIAVGAKFNITANFSPTLNFHNGEGLKYAISVDDEAPVTVVINKDDNNAETWSEWVADNIIQKTTVHNFAKPGKHIIKYWMVSPGVVLQQLVVTPADLWSFPPYNKYAAVPLVTNIYTADPSAHVFNNRIYIYPSHDTATGIPQDDLGSHFDMQDYHVFSMDSVGGKVKDHGVALDISNIPWAKRQLWAPDAAFANGTYYLYFPVKDSSDIFRIGVASSTHPAGPFKPEVTPIKGSYSIDPCVFRDDDGKFYMYFGGIWGGQLQRWNNNQYDSSSLNRRPEEMAVLPRMAALSPDMRTFSEPVREIQLLDEKGQLFKEKDNQQRFFEASWMHKYKGEYYFSYSTGDTHNLCYAIGDNPYGPFTYKGIILKPVEGWTSHHSIIQKDGKWYLFYHDVEMSGQTYLRNIKVTELHYNEDGSIQTLNAFR